MAQKGIYYVMGEIGQEQLAERMFLKYSHILTHDICIGLAEDIIELASGESGKKYRAKATVEVYNSSGRVVESTTKYSTSITAR